MQLKNINQSLVRHLKENTFFKNNADIEEVDAIVSHWLQSPTYSAPLLSPAIRNACMSFLSQNIILNKTLANELNYSGKLTKAYPISDFNWEDIPFPPPSKWDFTFIDLFAGIGGFRLAMQDVGGKCVFSSEWDKNAKRTYAANFGEIPYGDLRKINVNQISAHDVLCAGFPCQPFSLAGVSARNSLKTAHGFACETQGTLFFDIIRIAKAKKPSVLFLENVKNLKSHDNGRTFSIIKNTIEKELKYTFSEVVIDASSVVPQRRERCYIVCLKKGGLHFKFPELKGPPLSLKSILESDPSKEFTISDQLWNGHINRTKRNIERGTGFTAHLADLNKPSKTIVARYGKDGKECLIPQKGKNPRMLTPRECARLQGYPENFKLPEAKTVAYKQLGNSVAVPVIREIAKTIAKYLKTKQI